jgi:hypothetical protein
MRSAGSAGAAGPATGEVVEVLIGFLGGVGARRSENEKRPGLLGPGASVAACAQPAVTDTGSRWP